MQLDQGVFLAAFGGGAAAGLVILGMGEEEEARNAQLVLEAANVHGQPVTLVGCGLILSTGHRVVLPRSQMRDFPIELGLQRPVVKSVSVEQLLGRLGVWGCVPDDVRFAYFSASTGRVFKTRLGRDIIAALGREGAAQAVDGVFEEWREESQAEVTASLPATQREANPALSWSTFRRLNRR